MATDGTGSVDKETGSKIRERLKAGKLGACVFQADDCRKTYEELKAEAVEFTKEPTEEFYGVEAVFKDNSGNWFSMSSSPSK